MNIADSDIGLEHMLRECGQMFEAVISEEIRMKEELKNAPLTPDVMRNFPTIVARLLLMGQPLELMDGDTSNVPITWLKAVLHQIRNMTNNAQIFVLSIIGVQSSEKSTLLNALFGLQFPVSAGRCTRGIYCHLIPVDKESLIGQYDYVLVVDTEGLRDPQGTGNSTFKDNELATFAIGLADATIINMKGESWAEMKDILQIVAHGLIRVRKTKAELELMPRCMFVHQNVPAVDAEEKNRLGQEKQLLLLDEAIKTSGREEGFTEITKFNQVIKYDTHLDSWYFPDLWSGRPPKARISQDYIGKTSELKKYLIQLMRTNPSKLTISSFFLRMSDLWNAMLHNDFVLSFRNTQDIISGTVLNDRISHEVDGFKNINRLEQTKYRESIYSFGIVEELRAEKERITREVNDAVEKNFTNMKATLKGVIHASDICAPLKKNYEVSLSKIKKVELRRINDETAKIISIHMRKLEISNESGVSELKTRRDHLEKNIEEINKDKVNETTTKEFEDSWQLLIADKKKLEDDRMNSMEDKIKDTIVKFINVLSGKKKYLKNVFKTTSVFDILQVSESNMPQVTESDIVQRQKECKPTRLVTGFVYSKLHVYKAQSSLQDAHKKWGLHFKNQRDLEFEAAHLEQILFEVGDLLGFSRKEHEAGHEYDEMCLVLPQGYKFTHDYTIRFIKFACHYTYNRSLENSKIFISMTDPLADIEERYTRSISHYRQLSAEANIEAASKQIFDYAKRSFVGNLCELIKTEVSREDNKNLTFKSKRAFLRTILTYLGQRTHNVAHVNEEKQRIVKEFMQYVVLGESEASENFFLKVILKLLKEMLTKECENASETDFQKMVENNVGRIIEKAKDALKHQMQTATKVEENMFEFSKTS